MRFGYSRRNVLTFFLCVVLVYAYLHGWFDIEVGW